MTLRLSKPLILTALFALSACGGGGDDGGGNTIPTPGTNGLDYGADGQTLSDAEGIAITMRTAQFKAGEEAEITQGTITLDAGFIAAMSDATRDGTIQIFGETVDITNGEGTLLDGSNVQIIYDPTRSGTYAGALEITVAAGATGSTNGEGAYVFGFETDPAVIAQRSSGSLTYTGDFQVFGSIDGSANTGNEYQGEIMVIVNFSGSGTADVALDGQLNGATNVDLGTNGIPLSGNGFDGALGCTANCINGGGSSIDATFYGPDADELGGVLDIGFTTGADDFDGVGTFILTNPTP